MRSAPLRLPRFRRLLVAYGLNQLGDWVGEIALAVAIFEATHDPATVASVFFAHRCGLAWLTPAVVGRLAHLPPQRVLPALHGAQAILLVLIVAAIAYDTGLAPLLPLLAIDGLLAAGARTLVRTSLYAVLEPAGLEREGYALVNVVFTANSVLAPAAGGLAVALGSAPTALLGDAVCLGVAAAVLAGADLPRPQSAQASGPLPLRRALASLRRTPVLRAMLVGDALIGCFGQMIIPIEVALVTGTLGGSEAALGAVLTAWGLGMVAGGVLATRAGDVPITRLLGVAVALEAGCYLGSAAAPTILTLALASVVGGVGNGLYGVAFLVALQRRIPDAIRAQITGLQETLAGVIAPAIGTVAGGALAAAASPRAAYVIAGLGIFAVLAAGTTGLRSAGRCGAPVTECG